MLLLPSLNFDLLPHGVATQCRSMDEEHGGETTGSDPAHQTYVVVLSSDAAAWQEVMREDLALT